MFRFLIVFFFVLATLIYSESQSNQIFYFKNGDKLSGKVLSFDDNTYLIKTEFGELSINATDLKIDQVIVWLLNGDRIMGELLEQTEQFVKVNTQYGIVDIDQLKIDRLEFKSMESIVATSDYQRLDSNQNRYFFADEELIDIYFDPTGFTLDETILYISGLSIGYGVSDRFQFSTRYWETIAFGSLNARFKYKLYEKGNLKKRHAFSVGTHIHTGAYPDKYYTAKDESGDDVRVQIGRVYNDSSDSSNAWLELFMAHTTSTLKRSEKGRIGWTNGMSVVSYPGFELLLRVYSAFDIDIRDDFKFLFEVFHDPYWSTDTNDSSIIIDYGIVYNVNEKLRFGIHFQRPFFAFYYKY